MTILKLLVGAITKKGFEEKLKRGEISQNLVAFIQETKEIWALGVYYPCPYTKEEIQELINSLILEDEKIYDTIGEKSQLIIDLITQEVSRATAKERSLELLINKNYTELQNNKADKDSNGTIKAATFIGNLDGKYISTLSEYNKAIEIGSITATDSLNAALGKLEYKTDIIYNDLFGNDNDLIINKWEEIVNFISTVKEGTDITDEFVTRKTDLEIEEHKTFKKGLKINGLLEINRNPSAIRFNVNGTPVGYLGITGNLPVFWNYLGNDYHKLFHEGNFNPDNYLPLTGGTMSGGLYFDVNLSTTASYPINFKSSTASGQLYLSEDTLKFKEGTNVNKLWHSGNDGDGSGLDADTLDGRQGKYYAYAENTFEWDLNNTSGLPFFIGGYLNKGINTPYPYGAFMHVGTTNRFMQFVSGENALMFRSTVNGSKGDWKQIATTDSTVENANKLNNKPSSDFYDLTGGTQLEANTDLNNCITVGTYYTANDSIAQTVLNKPENLTASFSLIVSTPISGSQYFNQLIKSYIGTNSWMRSYNTVTNYWSPWKLILSNLESYNAPTATKLATPVKLWGLTFDGSGNINGRITTNEIFSNSSMTIYTTANDYIYFRYNVDDTKSLVHTGNWFGPTNSSSELINLGSLTNYWNTLFAKSINVKNDATVGYLCFERSNEINSYSDPEKTIGQAIHLNYRNVANITLANGGGNVGIGTRNPQHRLDVNGNIGVSFENGVFFKNKENEQQWSIKSSVISGKTAISVRNELNTFNALTITESGNIGISTNVPLAKLHVEGSLHTNSLSIQSDVKVDNLNADKLDGYEAEDFALKSDLEGINTILESIINS